MTDKVNVLGLLKKIYPYIGSRMFISYFFVCIAAVLEVFGLASLFPLIQVVFGDGEIPIVEIPFVSELFSMLEHKSSSLDVDLSLLMLALIVCLFFFKGVFQFLSLSYSAYLRSLYLKSIRKDLMSYYMTLKYEDYSQRDSGEVINLVNEQCHRAGYCYYLLSQLFSNLLVSFVFVIATFSVSWAFGVMILISGFAVLALFKFLNGKVQKYSMGMLKNSARLASLVTQSFSSYKYLKVTSNIENVSRLVNTEIENLAELQKKTAYAESFTLSVRESVLLLMLISILYAYTALFGGSMDVAIVAVLLLYKAANSLFTVQRHKQAVYENAAGIIAVAKEVNNKPAYNSESNSENEELPCNFCIEFKNVWFKYNEGQDFILKGVSFNIPDKASVAIIGPSGSGKTTILDMVGKLIQPTSGQISIGGTNLNNIADISWRRDIGYVSQGGFIFDDTVKNNITMDLGQESSNKSVEKDVKEAAIQANAHEMIQKMPLGYKTKLGENGMRVSGGQKQRIAIARELYSDPDILMLDEATSALDVESENEIQTQIDKYRGKKTIIIVAHRLSTIRNVDYVVVLENGKVAEFGEYKELRKKVGSKLLSYINKQSL